MDLAFNNPQRLICHKMQPNQSIVFSVKRFQVFLSNTNSFICKRLNGFKYSYVILIIQLLCNTNYSI